MAFLHSRGARALMLRCAASMLTFRKPPRIFLSHSAYEGVALRVLDMIADSLRCEGFDVLLDKDRLEPGAMWRSELDDWINDCDAAILLLSRKAAESTFVRYETTLLHARVRCESNIFTLIPVRFSDVTDDWLTENFDAVQLREIQQASLEVQATDDAGIDQAIAQFTSDGWQRVLDRLRPVLSRRNARHELEERLVNLLFDNCTDEVLRDIGQALPVAPVPPGARLDRCIMTARALIDFEGLALGRDRFEQFGRIVRRLVSKMRQEHTQQVVNIVVPFCWVHPDAAANLASIAAQQPSIVAWGRTWDLSEQMYLRRALGVRHVLTVAVSGAETWGHDLANGVAHIRRCLAAGLNLSLSATDEQINSQVKRRRQRRQLTCVLAPARSVDDELLGEFRRRWPDVVVFLHEPGLTRVAFADWNLGDIPFLEPELTSDAESDARSEWAMLMTEAGAAEDMIASGKAFS